MTNHSLLKVTNLSIAFQRQSQWHYAVQNLQFNLQKNECLALVGESGSGKSMTALAIMQLLPPAAFVNLNSSIIYHQQDILKLTEKKMRYIRGARIAMIFQDAMSALNPVFTIGEQLHEVLRLHLKLSRKNTYHKAANLLDDVGIIDAKHCLAAYPHELSGGMRQRAMIAMALACNPDILIADEPTTALDVTIQAQVMQLLIDLKNKYQKTILFISHDLGVVSQIADRILVMQNGQEIENDTMEDFFAKPKTPYSNQLLKAIPLLTHRQEAKDTKSLLNVNNLKVYFPIKKGLLRRTKGYIKAVDDINLNIPKGQTLALVGESGSGKTTTGKAILHLINKTSGQIMIAEQNISDLSSRQLRRYRDKMQFIFQDPFSSLNPRMLVADSIVEGLIALGKTKSRKAALIKIDKMLEQVYLPSDSKWRYPHEFSGGQRQRICIARALALEPELLILDEPTSALDVSIQMQILKLLEELQQRLQLTYLLITHNIGVVAYLAHYVAVMYQGKIVEHNTTKAVLNNPQHVYTEKLLAAVPHTPEIAHHE